jgi:hypothetical protein
MIITQALNEYDSGIELKINWLAEKPKRVARRTDCTD